MTGTARRSYFLVLAGAVCCYAALGAIVRIIPGYVGSTLGQSAVAIGLAVGAPAITAVFARPGGGRLADRRGPRLVVVTGALVAAAGALPMFVGSYPAFVLSRLVVGVGEGAMMSASVLWLLRLAPSDRCSSSGPASACCSSTSATRRCSHSGRRRSAGSPWRCFPCTP